MLVCRICQYFDLYVPVLECQCASMLEKEAWTHSSLFWTLCLGALSRVHITTLNMMDAVFPGSPGWALFQDWAVL